MAKKKELNKEVVMRVNTKETRTLDQLQGMLFQGKFKHLPPENYQKLKNSIVNNGFRIPAFIWKNKLLDAHQRVNVLKQMQDEGFLIPPIPVIELEADNETDAKKLLLLINSRYGVISQQGFYEFAEDFDLHDLAFELEIPELNLTLEEEKQEEVDDLPDIGEMLNKAWKVKRGDIFDIGDHRLMCGDSTDKKDVEKLMDGKQADLVFTDPPYGVSIGNKNQMLNSFQKAGRNGKNIAGDQMGKEELKAMLVKAFTNAHDVMNDCCSIYVTSPQGGELGLMMMMMMQESGLVVRHVLNWVKNSPTFSMGRLDYEYKHEPIFYTWKKSHKHYGKGKYTNSVWEIDKPRSSKEHPTMKPVALIENAILNSSKENDIVFDPFGGSGSTMVACGNQRRKGRLIEISPDYCAVILNRMKTLFPDIEIRKE